MPILFSESAKSKQDSFRPWNDAKSLNDRIQIYQYEKSTVKFISLSREKLIALSNPILTPGEYIFLKFRVTSITINGPVGATQNQDVIFGPFWFDNDDYQTAPNVFSDTKLKEFLNYGNEEFLIFAVTKEMYENKKRNNTIENTNSILFYKENHLNAILSKDENGYYIFLYLMFFKRPDFVATGGVLTTKTLGFKVFNKLRMGELIASNAIEVGIDPNPPIPPTAIPKTYSCGWRIPSGS
jgi:hypothetical protein